MGEGPGIDLEERTEGVGSTNMLDSVEGLNVVDGNGASSG